MDFPHIYDAATAEPKWQSFWEEAGIHAYQPDSEREAYSIDTPPPTVSGKLHIGHVFSYTQTEIIARYMRMRGRNVLYPFGFDDNGLPTEILTEKEKGVKGSELPRETIVKSLYHFNDVPWKDAVISGHVIKKDTEVPSQQVGGKAYGRKTKISKSKDADRFSPVSILDRFGADSVRYWTASGNLGSDVVFDEVEVKSVRKLLTKLWNASRFAAGILESFDPHAEDPILQPVDQWALSRFNRVIRIYHASFEKYEFFPARTELEKFFWTTFCDNYLELIKHRVRDAQKSPSSAFAARWTLYRLLRGQLQLFAPYIPHITEELYQALFRARESDISIHVSRFPEESSEFDSEKARYAGDLLVDLVTLVRTYRSKHRYSIKLPIDTLTIACGDAVQRALAAVEEDLMAIAHATGISYTESLDDPFESRTEQLMIRIQMNQAALFRTGLVEAMKPVVTELKRELNLKAKDPIEKILIQAAPDIYESLQTEPKQITFAAKARTLKFNAEGVRYTPTATEGLGVAIEV